jgi:hypothetical protein
MIKSILLVGCGNIGSRHLQALVQLQTQVEIHIVEKSNNSQKLAKLRLDEISYDKKNHSIFWYKSLDDVKKTGNLAIIATLSSGRIKIIISLLKKGYKKFLIEKVVCQSKKEYELLLKQMKLFNAKGWVNNNRRYFDSYQEIKNSLKKSKYIQLNVFAKNSGLGSNTIHFMDLFSWFLNDYKIKLNGDFLLPKLFKNKRGINFKEFYGTVVGSNGIGSSMTLNFIPSSKTSIIVSISSDTHHYIIDELNQQCYTMDDKKNLKFSFEYTSTLTTKIVTDILERGTSLLPTLEKSFESHVEIFRMFNLHLKKILKRHVNLCPIT